MTFFKMLPAFLWLISSTSSQGSVSFDTLSIPLGTLSNLCLPSLIIENRLYFGAVPLVSTLAVMQHVDKDCFLFKVFRNFFPALHSLLFLFLFQSGQFNQDMIPTVGFNMRKITKGNVTIKVWDIGGQPRFRSMWERYCRGVNAIV